MAIAEETLRLNDQTSGTLKKIADEAAKTRKSIEDLQAAKDATRRLEELAATGDKVKQAALRMRDLREEVAQLVAATGNKDLGAQALSAVAGSMQAGSGSAKALATAARDVAETVGEAGKASALSGNQIAALSHSVRSIVDVVIAGGSPMQAFMQQLPRLGGVAASAQGGVAGLASSLGSALAPAAAAAAPVVAGLAVAIAAVGTAYAVYTNATTDAASDTQALMEKEADLEGVTKTAKTAAEEFTKSWKGFTDIADDVKTQLDVLNGKITQNQANAEKQVATMQAAAQEALLSQGQNVGALKMAIAANEALYNSETETADARAEASAKLVELRPQLEAATKTLEEHKAQVAATAEQIRQLAEYKDAEAAADKFLADREEALRKAREAQRKAAEEERKAEEERRKQMSEDEKEIRQHLKEQEEARKQLADTLTKAAKAEMDAIVAESNALDELKRKQQEAAAHGVSMATGGPSSVMSSVSNAGPVGGIIASVAQLLQYRTDANGNVTDGIANLGDRFNDFTIGFNQAIGHLPETLGQNLGKWIETGTSSAIEMVPDLISGLAENLPEILGGILDSIPKMTGALLKAVFVEIPKAIVELVKTLFSAELWEGLWKGFKDAMVEAWHDLFGNPNSTDKGAFNQGGIFDRMFVGKQERAAGETSTFFNKGGLFDALWGGVNENWWGLGKKGRAYDTGGYVNQTGMALVHQGERIIPASGASTGTAERYRQGGGMTIAGEGGDIVIRLGAEDLARAFRAQSLRGISFGVS